MRDFIRLLLLLFICITCANNSNAGINDEKILLYMNAILSGASNPTINSSVNGYWYAYHQEYGHPEEGPDHMALKDVNGTISGQFECGESGINGMHKESTIWIEFYTNSNSDYIYAEGKVTGSLISGTYSSLRNGTPVGIWRAIKTSNSKCL